MRNNRNNNAMGAFATLFVALVSAVGLALFMGFHKVDEGHIGVYYFGGALLGAIQITMNVHLSPS